MEKKMTMPSVGDRLLDELCQIKSYLINYSLISIILQTASHISLLAKLVKPEMLSTKRFYDGNALYRSHGLRNCRMLICIYVAFFIIALISILIRSNDKIKKIFICNPPRVFIQVSRPMFSTLRNSFGIILNGYCQYGC